MTAGAVPRRLCVKGKLGVVVAAERARNAARIGAWMRAAAMGARSPVPPPAWAISCRNFSQPPSGASSPDTRSSSMARGEHSVTDEHPAARYGCRSAPRHRPGPRDSLLRRATRASTASRADARDPTHPGLQHLGDVERVSAGQPVQRRPYRTRFPRPGHPDRVHRQRRAGLICLVDRWTARSPRARRSGSLAVRALVAVGDDCRTAEFRSRRRRNRSRSTVASSAQWTSSTTTTFSAPRFVELAQQSAEQLFASSARAAQVEQFSAELSGRGRKAARVGGG